MTQADADAQLMRSIKKYHRDPLGYVMFAFPWNSDDPALEVVKLPEEYHERFPGCTFGPDQWACEFLDDLGARIKANNFDGINAVSLLRFSTSSGHGIGKSALTAWLIKFIMDTRPFSKGTVTANTAEQLKSKTWAELGKWHARSISRHLFKYSASRGNMNFHRIGFEQEWFCNAQTCKEENSEAFAGQHAPNATSFYIFDEAGGIPGKIFTVREGGTTDGEPMIFDFGNPTRNSGAFFDNCVGGKKDRCIVRTIDSRSVAITNKERIKEWIDDFGEESDFVKTRVRGVFPSVGVSQFIPTDLVAAAMKRHGHLVAGTWTNTSSVQTAATDCLIIGVDVARFGNDESVIFIRHGNDCRSYPAKRFRGLDNVQLAEQVKMTINEFIGLGLKVAATFIDVGGLGSGVVDVLRHSGYSPTAVNFGNKAVAKPLVYRYRGDEMWGNLREALPQLLLPNKSTLATDLQRQLTTREFGFTINGNKIHLEPKKDLKARLGVDASPDIADALALTYAADVATMDTTGGLQFGGGKVQHDFDPFADAGSDEY